MCSCIQLHFEEYTIMAPNMKSLAEAEVEAVNAKSPEHFVENYLPEEYDLVQRSLGAA